MKIDILTIFPSMFTGPFDESIVKRAVKEGSVTINIHNLRDWATDNHKSVDDKPYGGGPGMIMRVDIMDRALSDLRKQTSKKPHVILTSAKGTRYTQQRAQALSKLSHLILIAGHYEGVDQRVYDHLVDEVVSIGDYVLTGGELPTMVLVDTLVRLIPGVLGNPQSLNEESHSKLKNENYLEYPQYTRPENYKGWTVPKVLLSGDPKKIKSWQNKSHTTKKSNSIGSLP